MVITVSCPSCSTSFPVDSEKVPPKGVNARCSSCGNVFRIEKPAEEPTVATADLAPEPAAPPAPPPPPPPEREPEPVAAPAPPEPAPVAEVPEPLPPPTVPVPVEESPGLESLDVVPPPAPPVAAPSRAEPAPSGTPAGGTFRFGKRDPTDKAKRLARVLVSDMIMYNADRHRTALEDGTLAQDFEDEIEKSWKEYVEQVGADIAEGPGKEFWRDALNDILAKGKSIF